LLKSFATADGGGGVAIATDSFALNIIAEQRVPESLSRKVVVTTSSTSSQGPQLSSSTTSGGKGKPAVRKKKETKYERRRRQAAKAKVSTSRICARTQQQPQQEQSNGDSIVDTVDDEGARITAIIESHAAHAPNVDNSHNNVDIVGEYHWNDDSVRKSDDMTLLSIVQTTLLLLCEQSSTTA
jgi:hypothetical protein